ncbi:MAG: 23S ribosomal RNA methyltransferase Erm [Eubacteriales bacterium]
MSKKRSGGEKLPLWVSQNFLTSYQTIKRVLCRCTLSTNDHVIEIGPGKGHITQLLMEKCREVTAVEIDERLYNKLLAKFRGTENLCIYNQDFLKWKLPVSGAYKVFANMPFCHTTAILRKLTESKNPPNEAWLTMEKGAAKRFMGKPRETLKSLMLKPLFDLDIVYYFLRDDFHPKPGVDIVLFHLKKKTQPDILPAQWRDYRHFITNAFECNAIGLRNMFTKKQFARACREANICDFAAGEILYVQWLCLFRCYCNHVLGIKA